MYEYQISIRQPDTVFLSLEWTQDQHFVRDCIKELAKVYAMKYLFVARRERITTVQPAELFGV